MSVSSEKSPEYRASNRVRPLAAWRAMQALFKDKEDTAQVFKIIDALKGKSLQKTTQRFGQTETGKTLLSSRINIIDRLNDREGLRALPEGSLGRNYLQFVESEDLSADGLMEASDVAPQSEFFDPDERFVGERIRDTHDLYHVLSGYGRDPLGEHCLLAYTQEHSHNRGIAFIVFMAQRRNRKLMPNVDVGSCLNEAREHAKSATWLIDQPWEDLLALPIEEVREKLNILVPQTYIDTKPHYEATAQKLMEREAARQAQLAA